MQYFRSILKKIRTSVKRIKNNTLPKLNAKARELKRRYGPAMQAIRHVDALISDWSKYPSLARKARANIKRTGRKEIVSKLVMDIEYGKVPWIPMEKRAGALLFVGLEAGGVEVEKSRLIKLGLDKYDVEALKQLVKNSL